MTTVIMAKVEHLREAKRRFGGYCTNGTILWFNSHGLSLREFMRSGYRAEVLEATGDIFGIRVAEIAREQQQGGV